MKKETEKVMWPVYPHDRKSWRIISEGWEKRFNLGDTQNVIQWNWKLYSSIYTWSLYIKVLYIYGNLNKCPYIKEFKQLGFKNVIVTLNTVISEIEETGHCKVTI